MTYQLLNKISVLVALSALTRCTTNQWSYVCVRTSQHIQLLAHKQHRPIKYQPLIGKYELRNFSCNINNLGSYGTPHCPAQIFKILR